MARLSAVSFVTSFITSSIFCSSRDRMTIMVTLAGITEVIVGVLTEVVVRGNVTNGGDGKTALTVLGISVTLVDRRGVSVDVKEEMHGDVVREEDLAPTTEIDVELLVEMVLLLSSYCQSPAFQLAQKYGPLVQQIQLLVH
jgi:hypothetical protein